VVGGTGAATQAAVVAGLLGASPLTGSSVTAAAVAAGVVHAGVAHLAVPVDGPGRPALVLAGGSRLPVAELAGLVVDPDLAVVTGGGAPGGALDRALLGAGFRHVVRPTAAVDARTACLLLVRFHRSRLGGHDVAESLHRSSAELRVLPAADAAAEYEALRAAAGVDGDPVPDAPDIRRWAPFVHIGL
jgi:hypothetical protein